MNKTIEQLYLDLMAAQHAVIAACHASPQTMSAASDRAAEAAKAYIMALVDTRRATSEIV